MESPKDALDMIAGFLQPVREKVAAEESYQDNTKNNVSGNDNIVAKDKQTNLGNEQSEDAKAGGSNVEDEKDNNDSLAAKPGDNQGTITLDSDDSVAKNGNIGPIVKQEINQQQKTASETARINKLANALLPELNKIANELDAPTQQKQASVQKTASDVVAEKATGTFDHWFRQGMEKRAADEAAISQSPDWQREINAVGGAGNLLDKIAMEQPEAILPPEALAMDGGEAAPMMGGEGLEAGGDMMPPEGGDMAGGDLEGAISEGDIDAIAEALAAEGITPEDMEQAFQDHQQMSDAGVEAPELAQALGTEEAPVAAPEEGAGEVEKVASQKNGELVQEIRNFLFR